MKNAILFLLFIAVLFLCLYIVKIPSAPVHSVYDEGIVVKSVNGKTHIYHSKLNHLSGLPVKLDSEILMSDGILELVEKIPCDAIPGEPDCDTFGPILYVLFYENRAILIEGYLKPVPLYKDTVIVKNLTTHQCKGMALSSVIW